GFFHVYYRSPIHWWDAYHYFMGAKYLPELGYSRLYEATWLAGREMGAFAGIRVVRDLGTYVPRDVATIDAAAVRARFSPARWQAARAGRPGSASATPRWRASSRCSSSCRWRSSGRRRGGATPSSAVASRRRPGCASWPAR